MMTLEELIAKRKGKGPEINYVLEAIVNNTVRIVSDQENFFTFKDEFIYKNRSKVKKGVPYHIRYTKDMREHYISEFEYNKLSRIILPKKKKTNFAKYQYMNRQSPMLLKTTTTLPKESDYSKGYYKRYFAKKGNELHKSPFEINKDDYQSSALYVYSKLSWYILGDKQEVKELNDNTLDAAEIAMPGIRKILPDYQFYRVDEQKTPKEAVEDKLFGGY